MWKSIPSSFGFKQVGVVALEGVHSPLIHYENHNNLQKMGNYYFVPPKI